MTEDDDILAAEFALGLLDPTEAEAVQARARTDAALSLRIAWWRDQMAPLVGEVATDPPAALWSRIAAQIPSNDNAPNLIARWRAAAISSMAVAAALLVFVVTRPPPPLPPAVERLAPPMIVALAGEKGALVAVSYERRAGTLTVAPTVLDAGDGDTELWIIPEGGSPRSMGVVNAKLVRDYVVPKADRDLIKPGATFAISREQKNGSPDGSPHGPILAAGKIVRT